MLMINKETTTPICKLTVQVSAPLPFVERSLFLLTVTGAMSDILQPTVEKNMNTDRSQTRVIYKPNIAPPYQPDVDLSMHH